MEALQGIGAIIDRYDYLLVDLWGVIHDGSALYPGALDTLKYLRQHNKKVVFISNAPRRANAAIQVLERLGVGNDLYHAVITSGETALYKVTSSPLEYSKKLSRKYLYIGPEKDSMVMDATGLTMVSNTADAAFAVCTGYEHDDQDTEHFIPLLSAMKAHNVPMLCVNPDLMVVKQCGKTIYCAGVIARQYKEMGGTVHYFGKPYEDIYKLAIGHFGNVPKEKILAIGDGMETDILGANNMDIASMFISGGIASVQYGFNGSQLPSNEQMQQISKDHNNVMPTFISARFVV